MGYKCQNYCSFSETYDTRYFAKSLKKWCIDGHSFLQAPLEEHSPPETVADVLPALKQMAINDR